MFPITIDIWRGYCLALYAHLTEKRVRDIINRLTAGKNPANAVPLLRIERSRLP